MDKELFIQNIKNCCQLKGVRPTIACRESGVGSSFINNVEARGSIPSVEKVQMLAEYLGVTISELVGEVPFGTYAGTKMPAISVGPSLSDAENALLSAYRIASEADRAIIDNIVSRYRSAEKAKNLA